MANQPTKTTAALAQLRAGFEALSAAKTPMRTTLRTFELPFIFLLRVRCGIAPESRSSRVVWGCILERVRLADTPSDGCSAITKLSKLLVCEFIKQPGDFRWCRLLQKDLIEFGQLCAQQKLDSADARFVFSFELSLRPGLPVSGIEGDTRVRYCIHPSARCPPTWKAQTALSRLVITQSQSGQSVGNSEMGFQSGMSTPKGQPSSKESLWKHIVPW
jgi:hypothetical protein